MVAIAVILLLLTFGGLSEAIRCYQCTGQDYNCSGENQQEVECNVTVQGCSVEKKTGPAPHMSKYCAMGNDLSELACMQEKMHQSGDCVKGTEQEITQYYTECSTGVNASTESVDTNNFMLKLSVNGYEFRKRSAINVQQKDAMMSMCVCRTSLCNTDDLGDGDPESPEPSTEPTNPTNSTTAPTKSTEGITTPTPTIPTNATTAPTKPTDATTTPSNPTTTVSSTTPTSPIHSSSVSSTPANINSSSSTPANVNSSSLNPISGNTMPATTPRSSGAKMVNAGVVPASVIIFLLTNQSFN